MHIEEVLRGVGLVRRTGSSVNVTSIEYDSRKVAPGALFVAMQGGTTDGNRYIAAAIECGANASVTELSRTVQDAAVKYPDITLAEVAHGR